MSEIFYTVLYILLSLCMIYPPAEFINAGFTVPNIFASYLGSESEQFITYHIKRSSITLLIYSLLPLGYIIGLSVFIQNGEIISVWIGSNSFLWQIFTTTTCVLPLLALFQLKIWSRDEYKNHPIVVNIMKFSNNNADWKTVAADINTEYRRIDKICIQTNAISKVIVTENWILKLTPLTIFVAHQSDASLIVNKSDTHNLFHTNGGEVQYINIEVLSRRASVEPFVIRLNSLDFKDLQDRVARIITVLPNVKFHKTITDKFIDAFKDAIQDNPRYITNQEREQCMGCMQMPSNIKLQKICTDNETVSCTNCYCRPMWCVDCMAKWFASKQDNEHVNSWLSSSCSCPMCRAIFCILDVCLIDDD